MQQYNFWNFRQQSREKNRENVSKSLKKPVLLLNMAIFTLQI